MASIWTPEDLVQRLTVAALELASACAGTAGADDGDLSCHPASLKSFAIIDEHLKELKFILIGDAETEHDETRGARVAAAVAQTNFAVGLVTCLGILPLEVRKNAAHVFSNLARRPDSNAFAVIIVREPTILTYLTNAYKDNTADLALICGMMLRESARHEIVAKAILEAPFFWRFFTDFVRLKSFEVASDAFELLKVLLVGHCALAASFLKRNYESFAAHYNLLLQSENYVTCRESVRLLGDILLQRANFSTMIRYVSDRENLKIFMNLLRSKKSRIQIEAFHVFKVFVVNPRKPIEITLILLNNKNKLVSYLRKFHNDKHNYQFEEEKALVIDTLMGLQLH